MNEELDNRVERMLRDEGPVELSSDFKRRVMAQVEALPAPAVARPPARARDAAYLLRLLSTGDKLALVAIALGALLLFIPGTGDLLALVELELADTALTLDIGGRMLSASLASVIAAGLGMLIMVGVSAYAARNQLISA
jgi:hypothetical protein